MKQFAMSASNQTEKRVREVTSSKNTVLSFKKNVNVPKSLDVTDIELKLKPLDISFSFDELDMLVNYYGNILQVTSGHKPVLYDKKVKKTDLVIEKTPIKSTSIQELEMKVKVEVERFKLVCLQPGSGERMQWMELNVEGGSVDLKLNEKKGNKDMKGSIMLKALKGELFRETSSLTSFDYDTVENNKDPVKMLVFGFEDFKTDFNTDPAKNTDITIILHRLYMKYVEMNKNKALVASDFQDVISNPLVESKNAVNQLEVNVNVKSDDKAVIKLLYNDFRIIISPPVILGLLHASNLVSSQLTALLSKLPENPIEDIPHPEVVKVDPTAQLPTKKLEFNGELTNIEIWIPRTVETNQSRVCQLSFTTKLSFSSCEELKDKKLQSRIIYSSLNVQQLRFIMLNKHLLKENEDISKASYEVLIPSTKISFNVNTLEDPTGENKITGDNKIITIHGHIESIRVTLGFREIDLFRSMADYYNKNLIQALPKVEYTKAEKVESTETKLISYSTNILRVDLKMDPLEFVLSNDTELIEQELFKISLSSFILEASQTVLLDESKRSLLTRNNDLLNINGSLLLEILFYNSSVTEYEPIIEKWGLKYGIVQYASNYGKQIKIKAENMLNLNISYAGISNSLNNSWKWHRSGDEEIE